MVGCKFPLWAPGLRYSRNCLLGVCHHVDDPLSVSQVIIMACTNGPSGMAHVTSAMQHINAGDDGPPLMLESVPQAWIDRVSHL